MITVGGNFEHKADRVTEKPYKDSLQTKFRIGITIRGDAKGFIQYIYCTVDKPLSEVGIKDGDAVIITRIHSVSFSRKNGMQTVFMTVDIDVKPGITSTDYLEGGFPVDEEYDPPEEEGIYQ